MLYDGFVVFINTDLLRYIDISLDEKKMLYVPGKVNENKTDDVRSRISLFFPLSFLIFKETFFGIYENDKVMYKMQYTSYLNSNHTL
jgi:hypothetical protein